MLPKRGFSALAGILALSLAVSPPLQAAGRLAASASSQSGPSAAGPLALPGTSNSPVNLSVSAPTLSPAGLPDLTLPTLTEPTPSAAAAFRAPKAALPGSAPANAASRVSAAPERREAFRKEVASMEKRWGAIASAGETVASAGGAAESREHGGRIESFLTGAVPAASSFGPEELQPRAAKLPPLQGLRAGPPAGLQPAEASDARSEPRTPRVAEPVIVDDRRGNGLRPAHPFAGFWDLLTLREAERPGLAGATLATALLAPVPGVGAIALHEYGHYLLARVTGAGVSSMHLFIPGGLPTGDGYTTLGFVKIGPPKTPFRNYLLSAAGPAFSAAAFVALTLAVPAAAVGAVAYGWVPGEIAPWFALGASALWSLWYWSAGSRWAFHGGHSDREHMDAARAEMFQYSNQEVRVGPLLGPALAHLQVRTGESAPDVLKRALKLLDDYHAASDRYGWVDLEAGGKRFRFPLQTADANRTPAKAAEGYRPLPAPAIPSGEHWGGGEPEIVTIPLDASERARLRRHKKRLRYPWNSWVFYGALHLYASVLETERLHGPVTLTGKKR